MFQYLVDRVSDFSKNKHMRKVRSGYFNYQAILLLEYDSIMWQPWNGLRVVLEPISINTNTSQSINTARPH
jgi:hypothetical protein